jgi:hypothetical protein
MRTLCAAVLVALALAACGGQPAETGPTGTPVASASHASPTSAPSSTPGSPLPVSWEVLADERHPVSRFGSTELQLVAILDAFGHADPCFELTPAWLNHCGVRFVQLIHPDGKNPPGEGIVYGALHPSLEMPVAWDHQRVLITAHYDDPAAQDCRYTTWDPRFGRQPTEAETVWMCRSILVITGVEPAG